jgi:hypothetical protein
MTTGERRQRASSDCCKRLARTQTDQHTVQPVSTSYEAASLDSGMNVGRGWSARLPAFVHRLRFIGTEAERPAHYLLNGTDCQESTVLTGRRHDPCRCVGRTRARGAISHTRSTTRLGIGPKWLCVTEPVAKRWIFFRRLRYLFFARSALAPRVPKA